MLLKRDSLCQFIIHIRDVKYNPFYEIILYAAKTKLLLSEKNKICLCTKLPVERSSNLNQEDQTHLQLLTTRLLQIHLLKVENSFRVNAF